MIEGDGANFWHIEKALSTIFYLRWNGLRPQNIKKPNSNVRKLTDVASKVIECESKTPTNLIRYSQQHSITIDATFAQFRSYFGYIFDDIRQSFMSEKVCRKSPSPTFNASSTTFDALSMIENASKYGNKVISLSNVLDRLSSHFQCTFDYLCNRHTFQHWFNRK